MAKHENLENILHAVSSIQRGLLRYREKDKQQNLQVKVAAGENGMINCIVTDDVTGKLKLKGKKVHLVQKYKDDYFFIAAIISGQTQTTTPVVSLLIIKACWFIRKRRGSVTWLSEKCTYEDREMQAA